MTELTTNDVIDFVESHINIFHDKRLQGLCKIKLELIIKKKNPYLFKAKNIETGQDLVKGLLEAHLSSQEEGMFGAFLEELAIFVCQKVFDGKKSTAEGIDLEFKKQEILYLVSIKSGPNWGNSSQIAKMRGNFKTAIIRQRANYHKQHIVAVNGCCYGKTGRSYDKGDYLKLCGQNFWEFISNDENLYLWIIKPLGHRAKEKNDAFYVEYKKLLNRMTQSFLQNFCLNDGSIYWEKIVKMNAQRMS